MVVLPHPDSPTRPRLSPSFSARVSPFTAWAARLGALAGVGNLLLAPSGPAAGFALNLLSNLGPVLFLAGVGLPGWRMWTERAAAD